MQETQSRKKSKFKRNVTYVLATLFTAVVVIPNIWMNVFPPDREIDHLSSAFSKAFVDPTKKVPVTEIFPGDWDELCLFLPAGSERYGVWFAYEEYVKKSNLNVPLFPKKSSYGSILIIRKNSDIRQNILERPSIEIFKKKYHIRVQNNQNNVLGGCWSTPIIESRV